ncbi:hypothetical protein EG830_05790 [bacterium]|nr:hypothetical protein [bacterium]
MKSIALLIIMTALTVSCGDRGNNGKVPSGRDNRTDVLNMDVEDSEEPTVTPDSTVADHGSTELPAGAVLIATDIVTEVIIRPDPEGDPWETEKVAGYNGGPLVDGIFSRIYDGSLTAYDYHSGEPLTPDDVKKIEGEFKNDRTKIGKLSFTEDWYYFPKQNRLEKRARSVTFGYELYNNAGKVYAYRAAFRADLQQ